MYPASSCANYIHYLFIPDINLVRYNHLTFTDEETGLGRFCSLSKIVWLVSKSSYLSIGIIEIRGALK